MFSSIFYNKWHTYATKGGAIMATGVICEFNPFHNGHKYLLKMAKQLTNEPVIAIMSGSFTQRGEVTITDKFARAKSALQNGADLVLELPTVYAVANAQKFAQCGTLIASSFSCANHLAFGCETDNANLLVTAANSIDNTDVQKKINEKMQNGDYYPRAFESAVREVLSNDIADILTTPNNILAVEYIRSLSDSKVRPLPIKRIGTEHDSTTPNGTIASASHIRTLARSGKSFFDFMPCGLEHITFSENLERAILYKLRSMSTSDFAQLPDVNEGLENRIFDAVKLCSSVDEIISTIKTKRYTHARLRRIIICALLGITKDLQSTPVEYVRVLGFTESGSSLLKTCTLNVVTSASGGIKLGGNTAKLLKKDIFATDISSLAYSTPKQCGLDFTTPIIKI